MDPSREAALTFTYASASASSSTTGSAATSAGSASAVAGADSMRRRSVFGPPSLSSTSSSTPLPVAAAAAFSNQKSVDAYQEELIKLAIADLSFYYGVGKEDVYVIGIRIIRDVVGYVPGFRVACYLCNTCVRCNTLSGELPVRRDTPITSDTYVYLGRCKMHVTGANQVA